MNECGYVFRFLVFILAKIKENKSSLAGHCICRYINSIGNKNNDESKEQRHKQQNNIYLPST